MKLTETFSTYLSAVLCLLVTLEARAAEWKIPLAGNTYRTQPSPGGRGISREGTLSWRESDDEFAIYFHVNVPTELQLKLVGEIPVNSKVKCTSPSDPNFNVVLDSSNTELDLGKLKPTKKGYVQVNVRGISKPDKESFAKLSELIVSSTSEALSLDYVRNNEGNMFYWGRRGPSVHLTYQVPKDTTLRYGYTELTVLEGKDPIGSYFMANGFSEGYFGMQVNSETERRILFSVWSPFKTDNPKDIPEDQRIELLAKGEKTRVGEFGNEGSGGQSFLTFPWKAGVTMRFLTEVKPLDDNNTQYTCWFAEQDSSWQLVASFRRPKTKTNLRGFHSFLESFDPSRGYLERKCLYGNVWVVDVDRKWHAVNEAKFSVDPTGGNRHRLDFAGGVENGAFYLHNCGFFSGDVRAGSKFSLPTTDRSHPEIDFDKLPR
ncbi:MAG: DUF3472 domain-containing protein [Pirellulales bacterium]